MTDKPDRMLNEPQELGGENLTERQKELEAQLVPFLMMAVVRIQRDGMRCSAAFNGLMGAAYTLVRYQEQGLIGKADERPESPGAIARAVAAGLRQAADEMEEYARSRAS